MKYLALIGLSCFLAACASTSSEHHHAQGVLDVAFVCDRGERLTVQFHQDRELAVMIRNGEQIELPQQRSASGFIYSNGPNTIRGKGEELTVEIGRMVPMHCKATS